MTEGGRAKRKGRSAAGKPRRRREADRYATASRLHELKALLNASGGATVYDVAERLDVSVRTAIRYIEALRRAGEPLYAELVDKRNVWRLMPSARQQTFTFTTSQMLSLFLSRRVFDFLEGTGFKEDLDDVFARLEVTLKRQDAPAARHLDRKIFDVNEAPHIYEGRLEHVNEILTALLKEQRLRVVHESVRGRRSARFQLDPYTLLVYKKGLYLAGYSHEHRAVRTFALDGFVEVDWCKGEGFEYPAGYHPSQLYEGSFGLIGGEQVNVRIRFSDRVAPYIRRRRWHPTQKVKAVAGGVELSMTVRGTTEMISWVLGFGTEAEVIEPPSLRETIQSELARALALYS
jgi:predicted DNA-binding transcriptional regulator YafY